MKESVRLAVIGVGNWGVNLLRVLGEMPAVRVVSVCDLSTSALTRARSLVPGADTLFTTNEVEMISLRNLDAVVVASPPQLHFQHAELALRNGLDVFVEKPMAANAEQGRVLMRLAKAERAILMVGHILEYHPAIRAAEILTNQPNIGPVVRVASERHGCTCGDAWWSLAPHDLGIARRLLGPPLRVRSTRTSVNGQRVELQLARGSASIHVSKFSHEKVRQLTLTTENATMVFDDRAASPLRLFFRDGRRPTDIERNVVQNARREARNGPEPLRRELDEFVSCIVHRSEPLTGASYGLDVLELLDAGDRSHAAGGASLQLVHPPSNELAHATLRPLPTDAPQTSRSPYQ